jgi:outer membrane protein assembly factor BamB
MRRSELAGLLVALVGSACIHDYTIDEGADGGAHAGGAGAGGSIELPPPPTCASATGDGGTIRWVERAGGEEAQAVRDLVVDANSNVIVAGDFRGTLAFGDHVLESQGGFDQFIAKLDCAGEPLFAIGVGSAVDQELFTRLAVDTAGHIVVAGELIGKFDFGAGPMTAADGDVFVVALDPDGKPRWQFQAGDVGRQLARAVAVDPSGRIVVAGFFENVLTIAGVDYPSQGAYDVFVLRLSPEGEVFDVRTFGSPSEEFIESIAISPTGRIALAGTIEDSAVGVSFGGPALLSAGGDDAFVAVLDDGLDPVWSKSFGSGDVDAQHFQQGKRVAFDGEEVVLLTRVRGAITFEPQSPMNAELGIGLARFDAQGHPVSSALFDHVAFAHGLAVAPGGDVFVGGEYWAPLDLGGTVLPAHGGQDGFFARLSPNFVHRWSQGFGGPLDDQVFSLALAPEGELYVGGNFRDAVVLGDKEIVSAGDADLLLLEADP